MTPERLEEIRECSDKYRDETHAKPMWNSLWHRIELLEEVNRLRAELATAKADAWDEGCKRGRLDRAADEYHGKEHGTPNPYRSTR